MIVAIPESSQAWFVRSGIGAADLVVTPDYRDDYLGQQVTKLHADLVSDAALICHVDSDCVFERPFTPADLLLDEKPRIVMTPYRALPPTVPWRGITEAFLGTPVRYEFMRVQPLLFPRWLYGELRELALQRHGVPLAEYVLAQPPRGFSEYNALGAYAYRFHRNRFAWVDTTKSGQPAMPCRWYWSHGGLSAETREEIERILTA